MGKKVKCIDDSLSPFDSAEELGLVLGQIYEVIIESYGWPTYCLVGIKGDRFVKRFIVIDDKWDVAQDVVVANIKPINDGDPCKVCKNDKVSKNERSCWRCGNPLHS